MNLMYDFRVSLIERGPIARENEATAKPPDMSNTDNMTRQLWDTYVSVYKNFAAHLCSIPLCK